MAMGWILGVPAGIWIINYFLAKQRRKLMLAKLPHGKIIVLIDEAINKNKLIHFSYQKSNGELSVPTVKPKYFKQYGKSQCVVGWCNLRRAKRFFAIARINDIKIVDSP